MARITSSMSFFKNTLAEMGKLRDETWSDITLKVGCRSVYAHRLVLAAHCGYFKTLFLSNFSDSKSKEIDLSSVVDDADILDRIINYMYYGDIQYDEEDFWEVARLASYFEMEMLMDACDDKMYQQVTLHNSVQYYMFAHSHGYSNIDDMTYDMIEGRFHDYFVFQESTLELRPGELKRMLDWGFFKNCESTSFLEFLGKWVEKGCSDQYVKVAKEIIEYLDQDIQSDFTVIAHKIPLKSLEECCGKLESKLCDSDAKVDQGIGDSFLKEFKKLVSQVQNAKEISVDDKEYVLFTLCERKKKQMLLEPVHENRYKKSHQSNWDSVYDVFAFRERSNCWYHINTIESHPRLYDEVLPFQRIHRDAFVVNNTLVFVTRNSKNLLKFDLEKNEWSKLTLQPKTVEWFDDWLYDRNSKERLRRLSDIGNHFAVCNNELYVVIVEPDVDPPDYRYSDDHPAQINGCYFEIDKVDSKDGSLTKVAKTSLLAIPYEVYLSDLSRFECIRSLAHVQINESSGEMLVLVYIDDDLDFGFEEFVSFVVNIKDGSTYFFPTETNDQLKYPFHDLYIVENEGRFLIVHHIYGDTCEIVAEYEFFSKVIVVRKGISKPDLEYSIDEPREAQLFSGGRTGLLHFSGYWNYTCELKCIPLEEKRDENEEETSNKNTVDKNSKLNNKGAGESVSDEQNNEMDESESKSDKGEENDDRNSEDNNTKSNMNEGKESGGHSSECRNVEGDKTEGSVTEEKSPDGHIRVKENEIRSIESIPPPFTTVRCVCEGKMSKEFLSTLKSVRKFFDVDERVTLD